MNPISYRAVPNYHTCREACNGFRNDRFGYVYSRLDNSQAKEAKVDLFDVVRPELFNAVRPKLFGSFDETN